MRSQYHLRQSESGLLAWDVRKLVEITRQLPTIALPLSKIEELDKPHWYAAGEDSPTCRSIATHARLIEDADLSYPIIIDPQGKVMDGMHRVCKALNQGRLTILAVQLPELPPPDFTGVSPDALPYDP